MAWPLAAQRAWLVEMIQVEIARVGAKGAFEHKANVAMPKDSRLRVRNRKVVL